MLKIIFPVNIVTYDALCFNFKCYLIFFLVDSDTSDAFAVKSVLLNAPRSVSDPLRHHAGVRGPAPVLHGARPGAVPQAGVYQRVEEDLPHAQRWGLSSFFFS